ncbi:MAG: XdhC family protein, partial [Paracoccaceae bacterium]|nr:XdhC family protein [Paracoccaceae bacterium]
CDVRHLTNPGFPAEVEVDPYTAIVLFFHDHDWEPPILISAATTRAFYIGAQGSRRSRQTRDDELAAIGLERDAIDRLRGPIGLIPATRDARTLAVSVLAEVLAVAAEVFATG